MRETSKLILLRNAQKIIERIIREEGYEASSVILNYNSAGSIMFKIMKDGRRIGGANYYLKNGVCSATYTQYTKKEQHYIIHKILNETAMLRFYYKKKFTKDELRELGIT